MLLDHLHDQELYNFTRAGDWNCLANYEMEYLPLNNLMVDIGGLISLTLLYNILLSNAHNHDFNTIM